MLSKSVTDSDKFIRLEPASQALYMHLVISADDCGFSSQVQLCMLKSHAEQSDYEALKDSGFIIEFSDGVIVITHWFQQNQIQPSKKVPTTFKDDQKLLELDESKKYIIPENVRTNAGKSPTQYSIGKYSLVEDSKGNTLSGNPDGVPPDDSEKKSDSKNQQQNSSVVDEIIDYLNEKAGTRFRNVPSTARLIEARLKEPNTTVQDFKTVIDKKCKEWLNDPEKRQYLRPETLFNPNHFESYLNAPAVSDRNQTSGFHGSQSVRLPEWTQHDNSEEQGTPARRETIEAIQKMQKQMSENQNNHK